MTQTKDRDRDIDLAIKSIVKQFGKSSIMRLREDGAVHPEVAVIPTGAMSLDMYGAVEEGVIGSEAASAYGYTTMKEAVARARGQR